MIQDENDTNEEEDYDSYDVPRCVNCGSCSFFREEDSDNLICNVCFTQSQSQSQRMVEDEAEQFDSTIVHGVKTMSGSKIKRRRKTNEEMDESVPLPTMSECCEGFQYLLKLAAQDSSILSFIPDVWNENKTKSAADLMVHSAEQIWSRYLQSWQESVEIYSKAFPELRFSFRDLFLNTYRRSLILNYLSAVETAKIFQENSGDSPTSHVNSSSRKRKRRSQLDDCTLHINNMNEHHDKGDVDSSRNSKSQYYRRPFKSINEMLYFLHRSSETKLTKHYAALKLKPDTTLLTSIIYLSLIQANTGVAAHHLLGWASNGSFKYTLNGFDCLEPGLKKKLQPMMKNYKQNYLPTPALLDYTVDMLVIACDTPKVLHPKESSTLFNCKLHHNIPILAYRLVLDLGVGKRVYDIAMALMGLYHPYDEQVNTKVNVSSQMIEEDKWLPAPLKGATPHRLVSALHVMSVILVACRMCKGWENWNIINQQESIIPWIEEHVPLVGDGKMMNQYIDFLEDIYSSDMKEKENYTMFLHMLSNHFQQGDYKEVHNLTKCEFASPNLKTVGDKLQQNSLYRMRQNSSPTLKHQNQAPDTNELGEYIMYMDRDSLARTKCGTVKLNDSKFDKKAPCGEGKTQQQNSDKQNRHVLRQNKIQPELPLSPSHLQYALLIEYAADKLGAEPGELHYLVSYLDKEISTNEYLSKGNF